MEFNDTLMETLGIEMKTYDKDLIEMTMPVDERTHQPFGFLHGGANVALAESAASVGSFLHIDPNEVTVFGMEINANHIKSKRDGVVTAKASPIHVGRTTMVWEIRIVDEEDILLCISRCTMGIVPRKKK